MTSSPAQERRQEQRTQARRTILDATEALLLEQGYEGFSIRRLVERCGYTAPTIYHHFGDKNRLLDALLEERFRKFLGLIEQLPAMERPEDLLRARSLALIGYAEQYPTHYQLLLLPRDADWQPPAAVEESRSSLRAPFSALWKAGRLRAGDPDSAAQGLWALLHGMISLRTSRPGEPWSQTWVEDSLDALLRGLVRPAPETLAQRRRRSG